MRECPVPNRWTRPPAPIASAHQPAARSIAASWVEATRSSRADASATQRMVEGAAVITSVPAVVARAGGDGCCPGTPGAEVIEYRLRLGGTDAGHPQVHHRQQIVERPYPARGLDLDVWRRDPTHQRQVLVGGARWREARRGLHEGSARGLGEA